MRRPTSFSLIVLFLVGLAGCEKAGPPKGSGALSAADRALFEDLPGGNNVLIGGNYMKLQDFLSSSKFGAALKSASATWGKGLKEWMECFAKLRDLKVAGGVKLGGSHGAEIRMAFSGVGIAAISGCADQAHFKATTDPDGKFVAIEVPGLRGPMSQGYLQLASGALYTRQSFSLGFTNVLPATRRELEADIATVKGASAAKDTQLQQLVTKVDRGKTMWFAGTGEHTPLADKVRDIYGSLEISPKLAVDITVQVASSSLADQIEDGFKRVKDMADHAPADIRDVIENLSMQRFGDRLRFTAKVSDGQLSKLLQQSAGLMGGGLGRF